MKATNRSEYFRKWAAQSCAYEAAKALKKEKTARTERLKKRTAYRAIIRRGGHVGAVHEVLMAHDVTLDEVCSAARLRHIVNARRHVMISLRQRGWSTTKIGKFLNRDHSTIVHTLKRYNKANA